MNNPKLPLAFISDPHACSNELVTMVCHLLDRGVPSHRIYVLGDLEDRGPNPLACTRLLSSLGINSIQGNHEKSLVRNFQDVLDGRPVIFKPGREYKKLSLDSMTDHDFKIMKDLPRMLIGQKIMAVHAGLSPYLPFFAQNHLIDEIQLVHKDFPHESRWWGPKTVWKYGKTEDELRNEGWERWYNLHDGPFDIVFGHSVFEEGALVKEVNGQRVFGIDTGCVFGGYLTSLILNPDNSYEFVHVKAREKYFVEHDFAYDFSNFKPAGEVI